MTSPTELSRRDFLRVSSAAGGGLLIAIYLPRSWSRNVARPSRITSAPLELNAYVEIAADGAVTIVAPCPEIGQGVRTSLPMMVAEELGVDWSTIAYRQASADQRYGGMTVGGSDSVTDYWEPLRAAGATARQLLVEAAAADWGIDPAECRVDRGVVLHPPSERSASFGDLADAAAQLSPPSDLRLKEPNEFELVGTRVRGVDVPAIVTGAAEFGLDLRVPGMLYCVVARPPVHGGRIASFDSSDALQVPGVREVVEVEPQVVAGQLYGAVRGGVAVIADNTWAAMQGREALRVTWDDGRHAQESSEGISARFRQRASGAGETVLRDEGDAAGVIASSTRQIEAEYELPTIGHACMEPINFTADVSEDRCVVWGPTQNPRFLHAVLAFGLGLPREAVEVHPTLSGGGFGRRLAYDYGVEAAMISRQIGAPLKVVWSREDDLRHDYYRTPSYHRMRAGIDGSGRVLAWHHHVLTESLVRNSEIPRAGDEPEHPGLYDVAGAADMPYEFANVLIEYTPIEVGLQMGSWRSVSHSFNVFAVNSFIDEIAHATGTDPLELQLRLLGEPRIAEIHLPLPGRRGRPRPDTGLLRSVLEAAAERAGWGTPLPRGRGRGRGRGIACSYYKLTYAAHVAEVSVDERGDIRVDRIVAAIDCGRVVNPSGAEAQAEGAAIDGLASVMNWQITVENGRVREGNFDAYPLVRIGEAPEIEVHFLPSDREPSGLGEPPYPSVPPAITNAIFAASGRRIRRLPMGA